MIKSAAAAGGIANYFDAGNQFPNVVSLVNAARLILHGLADQFSHDPDCGSLFRSKSKAFPYRSRPSPVPVLASPVSSGTRNFDATSMLSLQNDIAVISLAQPITTIRPVTIAGLVPAPGTVLVSAGYGASGTGTNCCNVDNKRRNMTIEFGALRYTPPRGRHPAVPAGPIPRTR